MAEFGAQNESGSAIGRHGLEKQNAASFLNRNIASHAALAKRKSAQRVMGSYGDDAVLLMHGYVRGYDPDD